MKGCLLLARKDLTVLFRSPLAWILLTCFLVICGYFFVSAVRYFELVSMQLMRNSQAMDITAMELVVGPFLQNSGVILLFFLPLLTMRGFSEEKKMGTFEVLMSYPLREAHLVGGKLLALAGFLFVALAFNALSPALLFLFTTPELPAVLVGYLGLYLMAVGFAALGLFLSTLTENQIVSASLTFAALLLLWLLSWLKSMVPPSVEPVVLGVSLLSHFESFTKGVFDVADAIYYLTFTAGFFWLSVLSLENQRWRG